MANVKNAGVREIIIDQCLQKRRGYTINELKDRVNETLEFEGLPLVTSGNTIRNDLENIGNRHKQALEKFKRGHAICYRYKDASFSIFNGQLTTGEMRQLYRILQNLKFMDQFQGSELCTHLMERIKDQVYLDCYEQPILIYENTMTLEEQRNILSLCECMGYKQPVHLVYKDKASTLNSVTVHPYFLRQERMQWHLMGCDEHTRKPVRIPTCKIVSVEEADNVEFVPNTIFNMEEFYKILKEDMKE
jgi:hypothetical protein